MFNIFGKKNNQQQAKSQKQHIFPKPLQKGTKENQQMQQALGAASILAGIIMAGCQLFRGLTEADDAFGNWKNNSK